MDVEISNLTKKYAGTKESPGGVTALDGVTLSIGQGMFGLLGPNGAGKTTMMKIVATLLEPTEGMVRVGPHDVRKEPERIRTSLGYLSQEFSCYPKARVREFVQYIARLNGLKGARLKESVDKALESVGLQDVGSRKVRKLSGGMIRRLGVAQALVGSPKLLIVDEPTVGLDPEERIKFRSLLQELGAEVTVILSTHIVADISSTCNSIALLDKGRIVFKGSPHELLEKAQGKTWELETDLEKEEVIKRSFTVVSSTSGQEGRIRLRLVGEAREGIPLKPVNPTLEDAYICFMESEGSRVDAVH